MVREKKRKKGRGFKCIWFISMLFMLGEVGLKSVKEFKIARSGGLQRCSGTVSCSTTASVLRAGSSSLLPSRWEPFIISTWSIVSSGLKPGSRHPVQCLLGAVLHAGEEFPCKHSHCHFALLLKIPFQAVCPYSAMFFSVAGLPVQHGLCLCWLLLSCGFSSLYCFLFPAVTPRGRDKTWLQVFAQCNGTLVCYGRSLKVL